MSEERNMDFDKEHYYKIPEKVSFDFDQRRLLCVVKREQYGEQPQATLAAISKAIKLTFDQDVAVVVLEKDQKISLGEALVKFDVVIYFGVNPEHTGLNIDAKLYRIFSMERVQLLIAHNLIDIAGDKNKKLYLWKCLQMLFEM
ncbi:MAG TPA: hypothetical protein PLZ32_22405 [Saprospiraceae bacterium]|nr:hypothetical protein [Saprospiraceae bacterium]